MTTPEAIKIIKEMQKWRRGEEPYNAVPSTMPHTPEQFGMAIDHALHCIESPATPATINRIISLHTEYRYGSAFHTESEEEYIINHYNQP